MQPLYGYSGTGHARSVERLFRRAKNADVFYMPDDVLPLEEVLHTPLPRLPADLRFTSAYPICVETARKAWQPQKHIQLGATSSCSSSLSFCRSPCSQLPVSVTDPLHRLSLSLTHSLTHKNIGWLWTASSPTRRKTRAWSRPRLLVRAAIKLIPSPHYRKPFSPAVFLFFLQPDADLFLSAE